MSRQARADVQSQPCKCARQTLQTRSVCVPDLLLHYTTALFALQAGVMQRILSVELRAYLETELRMLDERSQQLATHLASEGAKLARGAMLSTAIDSRVQRLMHILQVQTYAELFHAMPHQYDI